MSKVEITTMVCLHDLLGFDNMVSVSGGTFDSAVGDIARERVEMLRQTVHESTHFFPKGTELFQLNDQAIAVCDLKYNIGSMLFDETPDEVKVPTKRTTLTALNFICAAAKLHQKTIQKEHDSRIGPAGRTFIILGKRWPIADYKDSVIDFPALQANLAYFEAYAADQAGSKAGFDFRAWDNIYINDYLWCLMKLAKRSIPTEIQNLNANLKCGLGKSFPEKLLVPDSKPIETTIFHRKAQFYSVMSHHAVDITKALLSG